MDDGLWYILRYKNYISELIAKGGNKSHHIHQIINFMNEKFFRTVIHSKNGRMYGNRRLVIKEYSPGKFSTYPKDNGYCPRPFMALIFGFNGSLTRNGRKQMQYDVYNCKWRYNTQYGDFEFDMDVCWRHVPSNLQGDIDMAKNKNKHNKRNKRKKLPWQTLNGTLDELPN